MKAAVCRDFGKPLAIEEIDVALLVDWLERRTTMTVRRIERRWAGLRTFAPDNSPVVGEDPAAPGFFWLAGQGGYGIMMAESLGRCLASLVRQGELPADIRALGVAADAIGPARLRAKRGADPDDEGKIGEVA